ncbi:MAG TPA: PQQ-dependent sugar dehydrogenase [Nitrososphaera sp.]|nr:PQQ-dependent sugar dehydrogenase [Nitrososphaera sp.]
MRKAVFAIAGAIVVAAAIAAAAGTLQIRTVPEVADSATSADNVTISTAASSGDPFKAIPDFSPPQLYGSSLKVEKVVSGLSEPTSMTFVGNSENMLVTQKGGDLRLVKDGALQQKPLLSFKVETASERGLLGVAYSKKDSKMFLYMTEQSGVDTKNRVYSYELQKNGTLSGKKMILDLPGTPGPNHDGGKMIVGQDGYLYAVIGDLNRNGIQQNYKGAGAPDNSSAILKVSQDGAPAANVLSGAGGLGNYYYAYGVRNSFGLAFDPRTEKLWDTENGPDKYDEINVVEPGFNSGWERVMGPISRTPQASEDEMVMYGGAHYSDPVFSWLQPLGVTDIEFLNSTKLGKYAYNVFVGDINNGDLYYFTVNDKRDGFLLGGNLSDRVADSNAEASAITFGTGFGGITDIATGPDGYLYILSYGDGSVYRIVPATEQ